MLVKKRAAQYKLRRIRNQSTIRGLSDPSRTAGIVRSYRADLNRRWSRIESLIWQTVVVNDALRLGQPTASLPVAAARAATVFDFPTDPAGKIDGFINWLNEALDDEVLEVTRGPLGRVTRNTQWQSVYVRSAYSRGLEHANRALGAAGADLPAEAIADIFNAPIHADTLRALYSRQFSELTGITNATSQQISRVLTTGFATGQGPRDMAREMRRAVHTIGRNRSVTLARTETINAHAQSTLNRYSDAGISNVVGQAEFMTAGDDRVCPDCQFLEAQRYTLDNARGVIPVHPNCRCVWLPVIGEAVPPPPPPPSLLGTRARITGASPRMFDDAGRMVAGRTVRSDNVRAAIARQADDVDEFFAANGINMSHEEFVRRMMNVPDDFGLSIETLKTVSGTRRLNVSVDLVGPDGKYAGLISRQVVAEAGMPRVVKHELFELAGAAQAQKIGRRVLRSSVELYREVGFDIVALQANIDVGGYAWARFGFLPSQEEWGNVLDRILKKFTARELIAEFGQEAFDGFTQIVGDNLRNPKGIRALAASVMGKRVLMGRSWLGQLDLRDADTMEFFNEYVGR
jgi:SPP1 gp7 family putative phage head morphogenesis protein